MKLRASAQVVVFTSGAAVTLLSGCAAPVDRGDIEGGSSSTTTPATGTPVAPGMTAVPPAGAPATGAPGEGASTPVTPTSPTSPTSPPTSTPTDPAASTPGTGATPPAGAAPIEAAAGWVAGDRNTAGVQGAFYTFSDADAGGGSTISPATFMAVASGPLCAEGTAAQVPAATECPGANDCFGTYWGAGIGLNLNQATTTPNPPMPYDAVVQGVQGFSFTVGGTNVPAAMRFKVKVDGDASDYCVPITPGVNNVRFDNLHENCWLGSTGPTPDPTGLTAIQWQVTTNDISATPYHFCVENLSAIL